MKIIHTADLHLGQVIYQQYDRTDESRAVIAQLRNLCQAEQPDALVVSGDVFDIPQPSAGVRRMFCREFVEIARQSPQMAIVIIAGNHDSASRLEEEAELWGCINTHIFGPAPTTSAPNDRYIIELPTGFILAIPFMSTERPEARQELLNRIAARNTNNRPVVCLSHLAVTGMDATGHGQQIGSVATTDAALLGSGYDYLALGHIHMPQTINHRQDAYATEVTYPAPVMRYSGSAMHVSCDETYPHTFSVVNITHHGGDVNIRQVKIEQLRHFFTLPIGSDAPFASEEDALCALQEWTKSTSEGYFRFRFDHQADLSPNFAQKVYDLIESANCHLRFNPKHIWEGTPAASATSRMVTFEVAELQQMDNPLEFVKRIQPDFPDLDYQGLKSVFSEILKEIENED